MNLFNFIKSLLPNFERSRIFEDIETIREQLNGKLKKIYADAVAQLSGNRAFKSDFAKNNQAAFERAVRPRGNQNYLEYTALVLELLAHDTKLFKELVERHFNKQVSSDGLSFVSANLLQTINAATFVTDYARRLVLMTLGFETQQLLEAREGAAPGVTKAELLWMDKHRDAFFECLQVFDVKPTELRIKLESVPDMVAAPEDYAQLESVVGGTTAVDPLALGFIPLRYNPIYRLRLQYTNYQVTKYRGLQAELEAIELRLVALKYARDGKSDPAVESEITDLEARVSDTYFKLQKMEESYA